MSRRLPGEVMWPVPPIAGESLMSWITRTAHENVLPSPYTIIRAIGLAYTAKPLSLIARQEMAADLALVLGADRAEVRSRMVSAHEVPGFVRFNGQAVRERFITPGTRRFSPSTLARTGSHSAAAMMKILPFCAESWEFLQDACACCGTVQRWRHAGDLRRCDRCGADLAAQPADQVELVDRDPLRALAALLGADGESRSAVLGRLPGQLSLIGAGEAVELARMIASIVDHKAAMPKSRFLEADQQKRTARALARAWRALTDGERGISELILESSEKGRRRRGDKGLVAILTANSNETQLPVIREKLLGILSRLSNDDGTFPHENMKIKNAAWALGATETTVAAARDEGVLILRVGMHNGRLLRNLHRPEIERLETIKRTRLRRTPLGAMLGLPGYAVEEIIGRGTIPSEDHPWLRLRYGGPQVIPENVDALLAELARAAIDPVGEEVDLGRVMRGCGGGPKPWSGALDMLKAGEVAFRIEQGDSNICRILVAKRDGPRFWRLERQAWAATYSQVDSLDILNVSPKHNSSMRSMKLDVASDGRWSICGTRLRICAEEHMSFAELAARTGLEPAQINAITIARNLKRRSNFGWDRSEAETRMADLLC